MGCASSKNAVSVTPVLDSSDILKDSLRSAAVLEISSRGKSKENVEEKEEEEEEEENREEKEKENALEAFVESTESVRIRLEKIRKQIEGELVAAGWPTWLTVVACEVIYGWLPLQAENFEKLDKIGEGTYSTVFRAKNLETGKIVALKKLQLENFEPEGIKFMSREIDILRRLDHPNVMKLEGLIASQSSSNIYLVFEYMEHDLSGLSSSPNIKFTEAQVKCYMKQLLSGLDHCHAHGIIHRDIKGANLLVNNEGILKIADFGLANFLPPENKEPLTSRVVTLWYRPPELLLGSIDYGAPVDIWSVGCVFAEMFLKKAILQGRTEVEQLHKIFKLCGSPPEEYWQNPKLPHEIQFKPHHPYEGQFYETFRNLPQSVFNLLQVFLSIEPHKRGTAESALASEYFSMAPLPCEPWSLPKYRPTKEIDLLVFQEDDRKTPDVNAKRHVPEMTKKPSRVHKDPQEPVAQIRLSNRQEAESRKIPHGIKTRGEKSHSRRFTGASRLFVDLQPKAALQPSDRGRHTKQVSQTRIPFSAPLRPNRNNSSALDKKPHEDRTSLKSHNKPISRNPSFTAPGPPQPPAPSRARMNQAAGNSSHDNPHDHHRRNEQYKTAKKAEIRNWAQLERPDSFDHSKFHSHDFSRKGAVQSKRSVLGYRDERDRVEFSGPLLSKSQKVDELLEKRDQHIRKAVRKSWLQRATGSKQV